MSADSRALARQRQPTPADAEYDSICAAVMETVRGRWFLAEYSRRNRHADTDIILAAIDRIETAIRSKTPISASEQLRGELSEALGLITEARTALAGAQPHPQATDEVMLSLTTMRELADVMRQRGVDGLFCTQLEARVAALVAALAPRQASESQLRLAELLEQLQRRTEMLLAQFAAPQAQAASTEAAAPSIESPAPRPALSIVPPALAAVEPSVPPPAPAPRIELPSEPMKPAVLLNLEPPPAPPTPPAPEATFAPPVEPFLPPPPVPVALQEIGLEPPPAQVSLPPVAPDLPPASIELFANEGPAPATLSALEDETKSSYVPFEFEELGAVDFANALQSGAPTEPAADVPAEIGAEPPATHIIKAPPRDPLAALLALTPEERIALFS